jgi:hypothetical protein
MMLVNLRSLAKYGGFMDSEALILASFTQIGNYNSLIVEIKFPVQSGPNVEEGREKSPGFMRIEG